MAFWQCFLRKYRHLLFPINIDPLFIIPKKILNSNKIIIFDAYAYRRIRMVWILHWPNVNFSGHKKWNSETPLGQSVNRYPERAVSVQVWYSWAPYVGCAQYREWNSFPRETRTLDSWCKPMTREGNVKGWLNSWKRPYHNW